MRLDFDLRGWMEDMRACKPPYKCPFNDCGKVYKTFSGISSHITAHEGEIAARKGSGEATPTGGVPDPVPFFKSPLKDSLVYNDVQKRMEFEAEGRGHVLSIYDGLECLAKDEWEATLPKESKEEAKEAGGADDHHPPPLTPKSNFNRFNKKKGKTPKSNKPNASSKPSSDAEAAKMDDSMSEKKPLKLPEAHYSIIDDYDIEDAAPLTKAYYRFIEKPQDELDEEVEYDMDEEDVAWLDIMNDKRGRDGLSKVEEAQFELLMDRLEKESYFHVQTNGSKDYSAPVDDDAICCVCMDGECSNTNVILFCDLCNLAVHQECYGVPYIPEGQWLCRRCLQSPSRSVECCLCPNKGGAFKRTDDGRWAHVVCGLWIPEVRFANTVFLEPIDSIDNIPPARWKLSCRVCKQRGVGACIQCHKTNCYTAFHVTCGLLAGLHMKMDTVREASSSGLSVTVRKTAFCDVHTPQDSDCKPKLDDVAALGISTPKQKSKTPKKMPDASPVPVLFRGLMNFSPQCPWEKVQEIAALVNVQKRNQFFQRLMAYWTLKRQTRNGVPLIRRLQFAKAMRPDKAPETPQKNAHHSKKKKDAEKVRAKKAKEDFKTMLDQRRMLRRLRQDLERVRLLCELIRKREQRKRDLVANMADVNAVKCWPFAVFLKNVLENLQTVDVAEIFAEPVSTEDVPDYYDHVKAPMDFMKMRKKLDDFAYTNIDTFEEDFTMMVGNCLSYNERDTIFFRHGVKMRDVGGSIIRQARRQIELIGFVPDTMVHTAERRKSQHEEVSDDKLMKEIDAFMNSEEREELLSETHLKRLLELQDKASFLHHPVAKVKRLRLLKQEITKTRRKLSMDKAGTAPHLKKAAQEGAGGGEEKAQEESGSVAGADRGDNDPRAEAEGGKGGGGRQEEARNASQYSGRQQKGTKETASAQHGIWKRIRDGQ
jgi:bromodomain and PHD finger-containing protein 1